MSGLPHPGSMNDWLADFEIGERRYVEARDPEDVGATMRKVNTPPTRRPHGMRGMAFQCTAFTAVQAAKVGKVRVLVCVERLK